MQPLHIPKNGRVYIGDPAQPLPENIITGLRSLMSTVPGVAGEHLPQKYFEVRGSGSQVLTGAVEPCTHSNRIGICRITAAELLSAGVLLDVLPMQAPGIVVPELTDDEGTSDYCTTLKLYLDE